MPATLELNQGAFGSCIMGGRVNPFGGPCEMDVFITTWNLIRGYIIKVYKAGEPDVLEYLFNSYAGAPDSGVDASVISFDFKIGVRGCEEASVVFKNEVPIVFGQRISIHIWNDKEPWYTGFCTGPPIAWNSGSTAQKGYVLKFQGYYKQLDWVMVGEPDPVTYQNMEIKDIIDDLVLNYIAAKTDIIFSTTAIWEVGYDVKNLRFDKTKAKKAIERLSEIAQNYRWGVDEYRYFFFFPKSLEPRPPLQMFQGVQFNDCDVSIDYSNLVNKIFVKAGETQPDGAGGSTNFIGSVSVVTSYPSIERVETAPEILDEDDALRWAQGILDDQSMPKIKATVKDYHPRGIFAGSPKGKPPWFGQLKINDQAGNTHTLDIISHTYRVTKDQLITITQLGEAPAELEQYLVDMLRKNEDNADMIEANLT